MDLFLAISAVFIVIFAIILWIIIFAWFYKTYSRLKQRFLLFCFKEGMNRHKGSVFWYYMSNITLRIGIALLIGLTSIVKKDKYAILWLVILMLSFLNVWLPSPFKETADSFSHYSINLFMLWVSFALFYLQTEKPSLNDEKVGRRFCLIYTSILSLFCVISLGFTIANFYNSIWDCQRKICKKRT